MAATVAAAVDTVGVTQRLYGLHLRVSRPGLSVGTGGLGIFPPPVVDHVGRRQASPLHRDVIGASASDTAALRARAMATAAQRVRPVAIMPRGAASPPPPAYSFITTAKPPPATPTTGLRPVSPD